MSTHPSSLKYRPDIDGLRAVAVLLVVGYHAFPGKLVGGFIGVDIFFVISGFLISSILFQGLQKGSFSFREFYLRRIKRIFPSLLLVLSVCYAIGWWVLLSDEFEQLGKHLAGGATFISNWMLWSESGYFDKSAETKPLLHLWSLAIEEQFYIAWPFLLWFAFKKKWQLFGVILAICVGSFIVNCYLTAQNSVSAFFSPLARFWELLSGALLAWSIGKFSESKLRSLASFLGTVLLIGGSLYIKKENQFPGVLALVPVLGAVLIILSGPKAWFNRTVLSHPILVWFGLISFPLYLWHWPLLSLAQIMEEEFPSRAIRCGAVLMSVLLAWMSYRFIEQPIRFGKNEKQSGRFLIAGLGIVGVLGFVTYFGKGFDFRMGGQRKVLREIVSNPEKKVTGIDCVKHIGEVKRLSFDGLCTLSKDSVPSVLVVGDSHTIQYQAAFFKYFPEDSVLMIAQTSCLPFATHKLVNRECEKKIDAVVDILKNHASIKRVFLAGHWAYLMSGEFDEFGPNWRLAKAPTEKSINTFSNNAARVLGAATRGDRQVTLLKDIPDLDFDIRSCFDVRPVRLTKKKLRETCAMSATEYEIRMKPFELVMNRLLKDFPTVGEFDPAPLFCDSHQCQAIEKETPQYFNGDHLNYLGADRVINSLVRSQGA